MRKPNHSSVGRSYSPGQGHDPTGCSSTQTSYSSPPPSSSPPTRKTSLKSAVLLLLIFISIILPSAAATTVQASLSQTTIGQPTYITIQFTTTKAIEVGDSAGNRPKVVLEPAVVEANGTLHQHFRVKSTGERVVCQLTMTFPYKEFPGGICNIGPGDSYVGIILKQSMPAGKYKLEFGGLLYNPTSTHYNHVPFKMNTTNFKGDIFETYDVELPELTPIEPTITFSSPQSQYGMAPVKAGVILGAPIAPSVIGKMILKLAPRQLSDPHIDKTAFDLLSATINGEWPLKNVEVISEDDGAVSLVVEVPEGIQSQDRVSTAAIGFDGFKMPVGHSLVSLTMYDTFGELLAQSKEQVVAELFETDIAARMIEKAKTIKIVGGSTTIRSSSEVLLEVNLPFSVGEQCLVNLEIPQELETNLEDELTAIQDAEGQTLDFTFLEEKGMRSVDVTGACSSKTTTSISLKLKSLRNPQTTEHSSPFELRVFNPQLVMQLDSSSGVNILSGITPGQLNSAKISSMNPEINQANTLAVQFVTEHSLGEGAKIDLRLPSSFGVNTRCTAFINDKIKNCEGSMLSDETKLIRVSLGYMEVPAVTWISLEVSSAIINPSFSTSEIGNITVSTLQGNYVVDEATVTNAFEIIPSLLRDVSLSFSPPEVLATNPSLNVMFTAKHGITKEDKIVILIPIWDVELPEDPAEDLECSGQGITGCSFSEGGEEYASIEVDLTYGYIEGMPVNIKMDCLLSKGPRATDYLGSPVIVKTMQGTKIMDQGSQTFSGVDQQDLANLTIHEFGTESKVNLEATNLKVDVSLASTTFRPSDKIVVRYSDSIFSDPFADAGQLSVIAPPGPTATKKATGMGMKIEVTDLEPFQGKDRAFITIGGYKNPDRTIPLKFEILVVNANDGLVGHFHHKISNPRIMSQLYELPLVTTKGSLLEKVTFHQNHTTPNMPNTYTFEVEIDLPTPETPSIVMSIPECVQIFDDVFNRSIAYEDGVPRSISISSQLRQHIFKPKKRKFTYVMNLTHPLEDCALDKTYFQVTVVSSWETYTIQQSEQFEIKMACKSGECKTCGLKDVCLECKNDSMAIPTTTRQCVDPGACPNGTFLKSLENPLECIPCDDECQTCAALTGTCTSCSFHLQSLKGKIMAPDDSGCIEPSLCDISRGYIGIHGKCTKCADDCVECGLYPKGWAIHFFYDEFAEARTRDYRADYCTLCKDPSKKAYLGMCVEECPPGYHEEESQTSSGRPSTACLAIEEDDSNPWPSPFIQFAIQRLWNKKSTAVDDADANLDIKAYLMKRISKVVYQQAKTYAIAALGIFLCWLYSFIIIWHNPTGRHEYAIIFLQMWEKVAVLALLAKLGLVIASTFIVRQYLYSLEIVKPDQYRNINTFLVDWQTLIYSAGFVACFIFLVKTTCARSNQEFYHVFKKECKELYDIDIDTALPLIEVNTLRKQGCFGKYFLHWGSRVLWLRYINFTFWLPLWMDCGPIFERKFKKPLLDTRDKLISQLMVITLLRFAAAIVLVGLIVLLSWANLSSFFMRKTAEELKMERPVDWNPVLSYIEMAEAAQQYILIAVAEVCFFWVIQSVVIFTNLYKGSALVGMHFDKSSTVPDFPPTPEEKVEIEKQRKKEELRQLVRQSVREAKANGKKIWRYSERELINEEHKRYIRNSQIKQAQEREILDQEEIKYKNYLRLCLEGKQPMQMLLIRQDIPQLFMTPEGRIIFENDEGEMPVELYRLARIGCTFLHPEMHKLRWIRSLEEEYDVDLEEYIQYIPPPEGELPFIEGLEEKARENAREREERLANPTVDCILAPSGKISIKRMTIMRLQGVDVDKLAKEYAADVRKKQAEQEAAEKQQ